VTAVARGAPDAGAEKLAAIEAVERAGGLCVQQPGGLEYGALLRVASPLTGYALALRLAAAIGRSAGLSVREPMADVERICACMRAAANAAEALSAGGDVLAGRVALLASGGYGELADNLALKVQEALLAPLPPIWDLIGFAHGPFQEAGPEPRTLLMLERRGAPLEAELLRRLRTMLDGRRDRLISLPAELPGALALFEHEGLLNELVLRAIELRQVDQSCWPGNEHDRPLYEVESPAAAHSVALAFGASSSTAVSAPPTPASRSLETLAWPELEAVIAAGARTAVLPLGATEQHGPHLPFATDTWIAAALAERFCARVPEAVRLPVLPIGCSSEHGEFPGTLSLHADTLRAVLVDAVAALAGHGFETVFIFSAHGGNYATLQAALPALRAAAHPARVIAFADLGRVAALWHAASAAGGIGAEDAGHHAGEFETSIVLGLRPEAVRRDHLAPGLRDTGGDAQAIFYPSLRAHSASGVVGDPRRADAARAERYLGAWVDALVDWYQREKKAQ
jgi:creatinine amidohydrolase